MPLSGEEVLKRYRRAGWEVMSRKGSPVKVGKDGMRETIPMHKELKKGLEHSLLRRLEQEGGAE